MADDDILWMPVPSGSVQYGALYSAQAAGDLLVDAALWQSMVNQQYRLLSALDRWIEQLERAHEDRTAPASRRARPSAPGRPGAAGLHRQSRRAAARTAEPTSDDATYAACRLVAEAAGITLAAPARAAR